MNYLEVPMSCVVCAQPIPPDRLARNSIFCSNEHKIFRKTYLKNKANARRCRHCNRPSTHEERVQYAQWRRFRPTAEIAAQVGELIAALRPEQKQLARALAYLQFQGESAKPVADEPEHEEEDNDA